MELTSLHSETGYTRSPADLMDCLVLASGSPRRAEILCAVGWDFTVMAPDIDEAREKNEPPIAYVERLALKKAEAVALRMDSPALVIGADTTVTIDGQVLGKPDDEEDARRMLRLLSGRKHEVITGLALLDSGKQPQNCVAHQTTCVRFARISDSEIDWYVATGEPSDKAGAYAAQGRAALFIEEIQGDYWNVIGLPVHLLYNLARQMAEKRALMRKHG